MKTVKQHSAEHSNQLYLNLQKILRVMDFGNKSREKIRTLTVPQMRVLSFFNEQKIIHISDVSRALNMTVQNTNNIVRRLEDAGIVKRTPNKEDKRFSDIELTTAGKKKINAFRSGQLKKLSILLNKIKHSDAEKLISTIEIASNILENANMEIDRTD